MSYTPHTWVDNETITAAKLNNIEDGVQEAAQSGGGGGNPIITFNFDGFGSVSTYWYFAIVEFDGEDYNALPLLGYGGETLLTVDVYAPDGKYVYGSFLPVPTSENMYLVFEKPRTDYFSTTVSGNISQETISFSYGSTADAYIITGDCTINISAI